MLNFVKKQEEFADVKAFSDKISLKNRSEIWSIPGKNHGEKAFLIFEKGKLKSYGFYEYFNQIQSKNTVKKLKIDLNSTADFQNDLKLSLLKEEVEIHGLPK